ncbi:hypothetical protein BOTBODRAFT_28161 [Botryobasidium botryosum FD-172 SS1]|uniref:Nucleolar protein 12 n=1 Tax=Botryobasidium botryosum (strain FD-172 SS1) TaxID=930990 RepID=A0A067N624_BOTB1|nr:hypothetical protein BOTBODRAFT_28161 [Botryobasidium botryosum FD-172 SS1]
MPSKLEATTAPKRGKKSKTGHENPAAVNSAPSTSLSSLFIGTRVEEADVQVDDALDAIFSSSAGSSLFSKPAPTSSKRKQDDQFASDSPKRPRSDPLVEVSVPEKRPTKSKASPVTHQPDRGKDSSPAKSTKKAAKLESRSKKGKLLIIEDSASTEVDEADEEDEAASQVDESEAKSADEDDVEEDASDALIVHESLLPSKPKSSTKRVKYVPESETKEQRADRTIFVGNVHADAAKRKSTLKAFKRHILEHVPGAKIESVRFRSVALKTPISKLPDIAGNDAKPTGKDKGKDKGKTGTDANHQQRRAAHWRNATGEGQEPGSTGGDTKTFLTANEKKRIGVIKKDFHEEMDTLNAYVVFAHRDPSRAASAAPAPELAFVEPYDAARLAVEKCDRTVFMERTIRVDRVGQRSTAKEGRLDPKLTVFVGNLDFAAKEEDVRAFFESVLSAERGEEASDSDSDEEGEGESGGRGGKSVVHVRIIRDAETLLGKGFAYVQLKDRDSVDEVLALEADKLKFAKRKLRVRRCKTLPSALSSSSSSASPGQNKNKNKPSASAFAITSAHSTSASPHRANKDKAAKNRAALSVTPIVVPKGNPALGERLKDLSKDERKAAKATDADRIARRLGKKKARIALEKAGVGAKGVKERKRKRVGTAGGKPGK